MNNPFLFELVHWAALVISTAVSYIYFRDLGDVTQVILGVKRKNMIFAIRHENAMVATGLLGTAIFAGLHFWQAVGIDWLVISLLVLNLLFVCLPWLWLHIGLRNQQDRAKFYSIEEAKDWVRSDESMIVIDHNGEARAHSDYHIKRPHLVGMPEGLGGENVIMTYCCMTHLGLAFKPEIEDKKLDLEVLAQHGNNLIMKDMTTGEPIQQVYGTRECDGRYSDKQMQGWPTYRMPFWAYQKAFPQGKVFLNKIPAFSKNPFLWLFDNIVEVIFLWGTIPHDRTQSLMFETMDVDDDRLRRKEYVWGFNVGRDSVAYTEMFIREQNNLINTTVGGRAVVVAYDPEFESVGIYYNDGGSPVSRIDFWGQSDQGELARVETVKAAIYWCVWVNFFPETDLNRVADSHTPAEQVA
ncbi:MAG: DUF3179 domain-containing (seleno)protein [Halopseudomonas sp.]